MPTSHQGNEMSDCSFRAQRGKVRKLYDGPCDPHLTIDGAMTRNDCLLMSSQSIWHSVTTRETARNELTQDHANNVTKRTLH